MEYKTIEELKGKTITLIERNGDDELVFNTSDGKRYCMYHEQDCCESVSIDKIKGNLELLYGRPLVIAREEIGHDDSSNYESVTLTDFVLANDLAEVTIKWIGSSNGYYSENVYFKEI